jgi:hypothetical protein
VGSNPTPAAQKAEKGLVERFSQIAPASPQNRRSVHADRPNPIGLHTVTVVQRERCRLLVDALEALDGTPILDLKIGI